MSRAHALALTDQQLALVRQAAKLLPSECRDWFLRNVADRLGNSAHPADADVQGAIIAVLTSADIPIPLDLYDCE